MVPENRLPEKGGFGDQPDAFMNAVEVYWLIPCTDALPEICHGLCNTLPAVFGASMVVGTVALLSYLCVPARRRPAASLTPRRSNAHNTPCACQQREARQDQGRGGGDEEEQVS
tara:strand:- start:2382 stop:2723 length:342 start_codon:yes stop_codon:yes gene_type:complete